VRKPKFLPPHWDKDKAKPGIERVAVVIRPSPTLAARQPPRRGDECRDCSTLQDDGGLRREIQGRW